MITTVGHPARYTSSIQDSLQMLVWDYARMKNEYRVLDPFAGVGTIHQMFAEDRHISTVGLEIEPEWANLHPSTVVGDAQCLPFDDSSFDAIVTSPCYGNRMADLYDGRDGSRRSTYRISLGRVPHERSAAGMQWGEDYRLLHFTAWWECWRVLRPGGVMLVNVSNHIRSGRVQKVVEWHLSTLMAAPLVLVEAMPISTPRMRHGANHGLRVEHEHILHLRKVT